MEYTLIPRTEIRVSRLAFGCWGLISDAHWGERDRNESLGAIDAALDGGINFFDTAAMYGDGESERLLGEAMQGRRDRFVVASKLRPTDRTATEVIAACEQSLQRMRIDAIDLFQIHWRDPETGAGETWRALEDLKRQGKVRAIGVCNFGRASLQELSSVPVTNQLPYNLLWRAIEFDTLAACAEPHAGILAYSPLMHGMLANSYASADEVPAGRARTRHFSSTRPQTRHQEPGCEADTFATLKEIQQVAVDTDRTMSDLALSWLLAQNQVTAVIVGARNATQVDSNLAGLNPLSPEVLERLNAATQSLKEKLGQNADMWQGESGSRFR